MKKYRYLEHDLGYKVGQTLKDWRPQFPIILSWVNDKSKVLDIGCGDGALGEMLIKQKYCNVFGVDLDEIGVKESRRKGIKAKVLDINDGLSFRKREFDVVINTEILEFIDNPNFVVKETLRVGKVAIIAFPNFGFWFYRLQMLFGRFPALSLYGHKWWNTRQTRFFSLSDFLSLPAMKKVSIKRTVCIDWKNRQVSFLSKFWPNFFGRSCILELESN